MSRTTSPLRRALDGGAALVTTGGPGGNREQLERRVRELDQLERRVRELDQLARNRQAALDKAFVAHRAAKQALHAAWGQEAEAREVIKGLRWRVALLSALVLVLSLSLCAVVWS